MMKPSYLPIGKKLLLLLLFMLLAGVSSVAQGIGEPQIQQGLIEYGPLVIPYNTEEEALSFNPLASTLVKELTWSRGEDITETKEQTSVFTAKVELPEEWRSKEKFLVIYTPKTLFSLEINGVRTDHIYPGVNTKIRLTPLLPAKGDALSIKVISEQQVNQADMLAYKFILMATPSIHVSETYVNPVKKYHNYYRSMSWIYFLRSKNYTDSAFYSNYFRHEEKIRNLNEEVVLHHVWESEGQNNLQNLFNRHWNFFLYHSETYNYKWSAEVPNLFLVSCHISSSYYKSSELIGERVGVRTAELKSNQLRINNVAVPFKPVTYVHPPLHAAVPTKEALRSFIKQVKQHNANTLLVYGFPANDDLYNLADEYGLYIIQQLGVGQQAKRKEALDSDVWLRQQLSLVYLLRNRPSVVAWFADTAALALPPLVSTLKDSLKTLDPDRPLADHAITGSIANLPSSAPKLEKLTAENLLKLKKGYQSVKMEITQDSCISIFNLYNFSELEKVVLKWKIVEGEKVIQQGTVNDISIKPEAFQVLKLPINFSAYQGKASSLKLEIVLDENLSWADRGHLLAWEEFDLRGQ